MAYSITPVSGYQTTMPFLGTGPSQLFIRITLISIIPSVALGIGLLVVLRAWICVIAYRRWVNRVEFESWWLFKALRPDLYPAGHSNDVLGDFEQACKGISVRFEGGNLRFSEEASG
jgi:hypothetical protein